MCLATLVRQRCGKPVALIQTPRDTRKQGGSTRMNTPQKPGASCGSGVGDAPHITEIEESVIPSKRRLTMLALACVTFFTTCGGAFGIEPLVSAVGPGWAVVMIVVTPFVWSLPIALMVAELSTRMPEEGGYYIWVRKTLGSFCAVQEAWWTMSYSVVLMAMFPVLFVGYLTFFVPNLAPAADASHHGFGPALRWPLAALVTFTAMVVNRSGARDVGRSSKFSAIFVLTAFGVLVGVWL